MLRNVSGKVKLLICIVSVALIVVVVLTCIHFLGPRLGFEQEEANENQCFYCANSTNQLGQICSKSELGRFKTYAVSTDSNVCAPAGKNILEKGGNAADAIISVLLCMGVTIPESLGLGGGALIVLYNHTTRTSTFINARETAPAAAYRDLYNHTGADPKGSSLGLQSIGVPGELAGYWHMYHKYGSGKVPWSDLFQAAINFSENGFPIGQHFNDALEQNRKLVFELKNLKSIYVNPVTGNLYKTNEILKQPKLAETLRNLSNAPDPHNYFYNDIAKKILYDLQHNTDFPSQKPLLDFKDFQDYKIIEEEAHSVKLDNEITLLTSQLPGSGQILSFILRTMLSFKELYPAARQDFEKATLFFHRLMETFKFAFSRRMYLGDDTFDNCTEVIANLTSQNFIDYVVNKINDSQTFPSMSGFYDAEKFQKFDHGTAHVSVLDKEGNAVSVTSTVNLYFGSKVMSPSTGLILNDQMDDFNIGHSNEFNLPISYANTVEGGKRPLSSMTPSIFVDDTGVRLAIGASGGPKIITAVAYTALRHLWLGDNIKEAIDAARLHHQLFPVNVENEPCFPDNILNELGKRKHEIKELAKGVRGAIVMGITRSRSGVIEANSDYRKGGTVAGDH